MTKASKEALILLIGDIAVFYVTLFVTLFLRYQEIPGGSLLYAHLIPFSLLFAVWALVFFIFGLYEKHTVVLKGMLPSIIWNALVTNSVIATLFFYFLPFFQIAPKTNLFIYLVLSFAFMLYWRTKAAQFEARHTDTSILVGSGEEARALELEINNNPRYGLSIVETIDVASLTPEQVRTKISETMHRTDTTAIVADFEHDKMAPALPELYSLLFSKIRFIQMDELYEDIFDRIPLSVIDHTWFLQNISAMPKRVNDVLKRFMDIVLASLLFIVSLPLYPLVWVAIKLDDGGPLFITQERIGRGGQTVRIVKFRSMTTNDAGEYSDEAAKNNRVTKVGRFLRESRIDDLPQLWNVIRGDLSLIGPRPELPALARVYEKEIPYYNVRHLLKPGLSGWAQLYHDNHPHHREAVQATKEKLSYDLYYVKNRSLILDLKIALRTVRTLLSRSGR